jgi:hypothetical protein
MMDNVKNCDGYNTDNFTETLIDTKNDFTEKCTVMDHSENSLKEKHQIGFNLLSMGYLHPPLAHGQN